MATNPDCFPLLRQKIQAKGLTARNVSIELMLSEYNFSRKMHGLSSWKYRDILDLCGVLNIRQKDIGKYFYNMGENESGAPIAREDDTAPTVRSDTHPSGVCSRSVVRRLTPKECERLQGLPDDWTDIGEYTDSRGKKRKTSDSARYKAIGNGIAVPFWKWLLKRISAEYTGTPTLGSLFDGIGTFPMIWEGINGKGAARWGSEIEEFPMAVSKYHLGEN